MKKSEREKLRELAIDRRDNWDVPDVYMSSQTTLDLLDYVDHLEEALKFYADKDKHTKAFGSFMPANDGSPSEIQHDCGEIARQTLAEGDEA